LFHIFICADFDVKNVNKTKAKQQFMIHSATVTHTSMATAHSRWIHGLMASGEPLMVTARSVEPGNISLATWIDAPVDCKHSRNQNSLTVGSHE